MTQYEVGYPVIPSGLFGDPFIISSFSIETRLWPVRRLINGLPTDPTGGVLRMSFVAPGTTPTVWVQVGWESWGSTYFAKPSFGAGMNFQLPRGIYLPWFQFADAILTAEIASEKPIYMV